MHPIKFYFNTESLLINTYNFLCGICFGRCTNWCPPDIHMFYWIMGLSSSEPLPQISFPSLALLSTALSANQWINQSWLRFPEHAKIVHVFFSRDHIKSSSIPWAAVTAHGFADSPVSWQRREHGFQASGENLFTFVVFQNDDYWLFSAVDSADVCPWTFTPDIWRWA